MPARLRFIISLMITAVAPAVAPAGAAAQVAASDTAARTVDIFSRNDAITAIVFALGTAAIMPLDRRIAEQSQHASLGSSGNPVRSYSLVLRTCMVVQPIRHVPPSSA